MANTFDKFLISLSNKIKGLSQSKTSTSPQKTSYLDKAEEVKKKADTLKSSLTTFNPTESEPNAQNIESIMFGSGKKTSISDWQQKAQTVKDHKKNLAASLSFSMSGTPLKPQTVTEKQKTEAQEFIRSGKTAKEIEEIKKEWLMEETKVRWDALNPFLDYEDAIKNPNWQPWFEKAEKKWDKMWGSDKDALVPSTEMQYEESLIQEAKHKEDWIKDQIHIPGSNIANMFVSSSELRSAFPDWYAKKEEEYYKTKEVSAYMGLAIKSFDSSLESLIPHDKLAKMEVGQALMGGADPRKTFTAMTLDIINFEDIANLGQDVYTKDGKIYYRGFEIDDEYLTEEGKQTAFAADLFARFTGGFVPYAGISGAIKQGVFTLAKAKDVPRILTGAQKLAQSLQWSSKTAPILTEMTAFNTLEEIADIAIRKGTGQDYTFSDFIAGITMGAGFSGTLGLLGRNVDTVELKKLVRNMEENVKESKDINSLMTLEFEGRPLKDLWIEQRQVYLKGQGNAKLRPGIEKAAPLPTKTGKGTADVEAGVSKVGASMAEKAVKDKLTKAFGGTAEYSKITIEDQAKQASELVNKNIDQAIRILHGEEELPSGLRGASVITALEDYAIKTQDVDLLRDIAKSHLTSETSIYAQEMRLLAERDPYSPITKMKEVTGFREAAVTKKLKGQTPTSIKKKYRVELHQKIAKAKPTPKTWAALIDELTC